MPKVRVICTFLLLVLSYQNVFSQWNTEAFMCPKEEFRAHTWYHWQNGHIVKEAVKADLESMKEAGLGGFVLFNSAEGAPSGPLKYMSEGWWAAYRYTGKEAKRLGLQMGVINGPGWSVSGGPWVKPEDSMQEVAWTETVLSGPLHFDGILPEPVPCLGFERDMQKDPIKNRRYYVARDQLVGHYHDLVIIAFPTPSGEKAGKPFHIDGWWEKAGYSKMTSWTIDERTAPPEETVMMDDIIDLTSRIKSDGSINWDVPEGSWTILRIGYQPTGTSNHPAAEGGSGLEVDKMSVAALDRYWNASTSHLLNSSDAVSLIEIDSYEAGHQNWTPDFEREFIVRMGYDPKPYLPAVTGRVIGSIRETEKFLWDYRKVISDLINENFYDHYAAICHSNGTRLAIEPYGQFGNTDEFSTGKNADILGGEFWSTENGSATNRTTVKLASSLSHLYGKNVVGAEAFTTSSGSIFEVYPGMLKTQGDYYFCLGMNQIWLHSFVHDPYGKIPGMTLGSYGAHFNRRNTWWSYSKPWFDYLARCQYMLQHGESTGDILYYMGEDAPVRPPKSEDLSPAIPEGYDYDFCGGSEILSTLKAGKGTVTSQSGHVYKLLVVKPQKYLRLSVLKQLLSLARAGATIYMEAPEGTPGLGEDEKLFRNMVSSVWKRHSAEITHYGKGRIWSSGKLEDILKNNGTRPHLVITLPEGYETEKTRYPGGPVIFIHKKGKGSEFYFISNQQDQKPIAPVLLFDVKGKTPEIWNPMDGSVRVADDFEVIKDGRIKMTLPLEASESAFVVFRKPLSNFSGKLPVSEPIHQETIELGSNWWDVMLLPGFSGPELFFSTEVLFDLSKSHNPRIKYHSGEILYRNSFEAHPTEGKRFHLDLGSVSVLAQVFVNGHDTGILWCKPYSADITDYVKDGENELEIKVVNLLFNRVAGDQLLPEDCEWTMETGSTAVGYSLFKIPQWVLDNKESPTGRRTFTTWKWPHIKDRELPPSGLLGPVRLTSW